MDQRSHHPAIQGNLPPEDQEGQERGASGADDIRVFDQYPPQADIDEGNVVGGVNPTREPPPNRPPRVAPLLSLCLLNWPYPNPRNL